MSPTTGSSGYPKGVLQQMVSKFLFLTSIGPSRSRSPFAMKSNSWKTGKHPGEHWKTSARRIDPSSVSYPTVSGQLEKGGKETHHTQYR